MPQDWYATLTTMVGVSPKDEVMYRGALRDVDGVDMWQQIIGANATNPRPVLPTTKWSLLVDDQQSGTMMKLITLAHRTNWFEEDGTAIYDTSPCVPQDYVCRQANRGPLFPGTGANADKVFNTTVGGCNQHCEFQGEGKVCIDHDPVQHSGCAVCSPEHPCLFDGTRSIARERLRASESNGCCQSERTLMSATTWRPRTPRWSRRWRRCSAATSHMLTWGPPSLRVTASTEINRGRRG